MDPLHATLSARFAGGAWRGVLLRGPSGTGKSTVAMRLLAKGWRLVADDRVIIWASGGNLWGRAPSVLSGRLEVRGVGVLPYPALEVCQIVAVVEAAPADRESERIPSPLTVDFGGVRLPLGRLNLLHESAPERVAAFCSALHV